MDRCVRDASNNQARLGRDRQDWQNLLFDRGGPDNQYIIWDAGTNRYVTRGDDPKKGGLPAWMPRPVTNLFANKTDGIISLLNQSKPGQVWKPESNEDEDLATADVCEHALPVLYDEIEYDALRPEIHRSIVLTDKVAVVLWYDNDEKWGTKPIMALQCDTCGELAMPMDLPDPDPEDPEAPAICPTCGQGEMQAAVNPTNGMPLGVDYPIGRMRATQLSSFEFSLPQSARTHRSESLPWVLTHCRMSWEVAMAELPEHRARIKASKTSGGGKLGGLSRAYADAVRRLSSPRAASDQAAGGGEKDGPVIYRLYHDPIDDGEVSFPQGLYAVMLDSELLEAGPLPFCETDKAGNKRYFKNVITRTYRASPGSQFGKPPADDLVPLQYTRNLLEALRLSILLHNASPRTFLPLSVTLEKPITGTPGEIIPYRSTTPGEVPQTAPGMNPPEGLYRWIEEIDQQFDTVSKMNAVLQGERPSGDPTLGEIQILKERGESAFAEPLLELVRFERQLSRMLLWIARDTLWVDRFRQIKGDNGAWEVKQFTAADLRGSVDVQIDEATAWPTSPLMEKLQLREAMEMQVFPLFMQDPELAGKILEKMGLTEFKPSFDADRKQIMRELDRWRAATTAAEIVAPDPVLQNLPLHLQHKLAFLKTEEAEQLAQANPQLFEAMRTHVQTIQQQIAQAMAAQAMAQAGGPPQGDEKESGPDGSALDHAISSGALRPAGGAPASPLNDLVSSGVLTPQGAVQAPPPAGPSIDDLVAANVLTPTSAVEASGVDPHGSGLPGV